jgi:hypothetical protein
MWEGAHRMAYRLVRFNRILRLPRTTHYNSQRLLQLWRSIYSLSGARLGTSIGINTSCDVMYLATSPSQPSNPFPDQPKRMTGSTPASPLPPPIHYVQSACATSQQHPWSYDLIFQQLVPGYELLGTRWSEPHAQPGMEGEGRQCVAGVYARKHAIPIRNFVEVMNIIHSALFYQILYGCGRKRWHILYLNNTFSKLHRCHSCHLFANSVAPEPEGSWPQSQQPATGPYPEPTESSSQPPRISPRSILIPSIYASVFRMVSFLRVFTLKTCNFVICCQL